MAIVIILTFIAVFLVVYASFNAVVAVRESPSAILRKRLRRMARESSGHGIPDDLRVDIIKETPPLERLFARIPVLKNLERVLDHAGLKISLNTFLLCTFVAMVAGFALGFIFTRKYLYAIAFAAIVLAAIYGYIRFLTFKRIDRFTEQLPDALNMIARSLRAGHSLTSAVELVSEEIDEPARELFKTAYEQQKLGIRITDSLVAMAERIESVDLRFFTMAVTINNDVGGNLAEILDKLAETIRERLKIKRQVRVYTAQGRLSGYVLGALPIITFFMFNILMPGYEDVLIKEKEGNVILGAAVIAQVIGFMIIRKIINIRI